MYASMHIYNYTRARCRTCEPLHFDGDDGPDELLRTSALVTTGNAAMDDDDWSSRGCKL